MIDTPPEVTIFLSPFEAKMFKSWQSFHSSFELMVKQGVFDIRSGSATIHFDEHGNIGDIDRHDKLYSARLNKKLSTG